MKAQPMDVQQSGSASRAVMANKVVKAKASKDVSQEEMQALLAKLKDLVPNMPRNKKLSKLEIIQNVIDYIFDLQIALEAPRSAVAAASLVASSSRQPLGVLSPSANAVVNICSVQEASHSDKSPPHLGEIAITSPRPVSC